MDDNNKYTVIYKDEKCEIKEKGLNEDQKDEACEDHRQSIMREMCKDDVLRNASEEDFDEEFERRVEKNIIVRREILSKI